MKQTQGTKQSKASSEPEANRETIGASDDNTSSQFHERDKGDSTEPMTKKKILCRYNKNGNCSNGEKCKFLHAHPSSALKGLSIPSQREGSSSANDTLSSMNDKKALTAVYLACVKNDIESLRLLLASRPSLKSQSHGNMVPLRIAAEGGFYECVKLLLVAGYDVDVISATDGASPLIAAAQFGHLQTVTLLIEAGASINVKSVDGKTALFAAVEERHDKIVRMLLHHGADTNIVSMEGTSPLFSAAFNGYDEILKMLLLFSAGIDFCTSSDRLTPLHVASWNGHEIDASGK